MKRIAPWLAIAAVAGIAFWWDNGLQGWMSVQTGTRCGSTGPHYCYWSGFGSVFPWSMFVFGPIFAVLWLHWRTHTCGYASWCWRKPTHELPEHPDIKLCRHHHPEHEPINVKAAVREAQRRTHLHLGKQPGKG